MKNIYSLVLLVMLSFTVAEAATITWNGAAGNSDWHVAGNWIGGVKPGPADYAYISGAYTVNISTSESIQHIRIVNAILNITASGELNCDGATAPGIWAQGDVNNMGTINISNVTNFPGIQLTNKSFVNDGTLVIDGVSKEGVWLTASAVFDNNGNISTNNIGTHGLHVGATTCTFNNNSGAILNIGNLGAVSSRGIFNSGTIVSSSGATINIDNTSLAAIQTSGTSMFTNGGMLSIGVNTACANHGINNAGSFVNTGNCTIEDIAFSAVLNADGSSFDNSGTLSITDDGSLAFNNPGTGTFTNSGIIEGEGIFTISSSIFTNTGTIAPGFSPGTQTYQGGFSNGTLEIELASATDFDELVFSGGGSSDFAIGGTLNVSLLGGYTPAIGETFKIVTSTPGYTGTFASISYPTASTEWKIDYNSSDITIEYLGIVLPVNLIDFKAIAKGEMVVLEWATAQEQNSEGYTLQRSIDAKLWSDMAWIDSKQSNASNIQKYAYLDQSPMSGMNYYRLIQKDVDGKVTFLPVASATINEAVDVVVELYPNPVANLLNIKSQNIDDIRSIKIYNAAGMQMDVVRVNVSSIDISAFPVGQYWVEVQSNASTKTYSIIKR